VLRDFLRRAETAYQARTAAVETPTVAQAV